MKSAAHIKGHPLHPMLVIVPAGAFIVTLLLDVAYILGAGEMWWDATVPIILIGVIGGLLAAIPGLIDLFKVAKPQGAFGIGVVHGSINLAVVSIFAFNFLTRISTPTPVEGVPFEFWLSVAGVSLLAISGTLGWRMVHRHRVGVQDSPSESRRERKERRTSGRDIAEGGTTA